MDVIRITAAIIIALAIMVIIIFRIFRIKASHFGVLAIVGILVFFLRKRYNKPVFKACFCARYCHV